MSRSDRGRVPPPTMRGVLDATPLAHLLVHAVVKKLSGTMVLSQTQGVSAVVSLVDGKVAKVKTSEAVAHLGRLLLELGYLTPESLDSSLASLASQSGLHGEILVGRGEITEAQLRHGLRVQLQRKLQHCFSFPTESTFGFFEGFDMLATMSMSGVSPLDPLPAVWRGICHAPPWRHVEEALLRVGDVPVQLAASADVERFHFDDDVVAALDLLRAHPMRIREIMSLGLVSTSLAKLFVYCLFLAKHLVAVNGVAEHAPLSTSSLSSAQAARPTVAPRVAPSVAPLRAHESAPPVRITRRPPSPEEPPPMIPAELFRMAEGCLVQRDMVKAAELCRKAHEAAPREGRYLALLAWAESRAPQSPGSKHLAACIALLDDAIALDGACERAFHYRAVLYKQLGREALAVRDFRRAVELDPSNAEALREVLAYERRGRLPT